MKNRTMSATQHTMKFTKLIIATAATLICAAASAQGTAEDYRRAYSLREKFGGADKVYYSDVKPQWVGNTHTFWYVRNTPDGPIYVTIDADKRVRRPMFDHKKLAAALSAASGKDIAPATMRFSNLTIDESLTAIDFGFESRRWHYDIRHNRLSPIPTPTAPNKPARHWMEVDDEKGGGPVTSPDGRHTAYIKNHNIYVRDESTQTEKQLSVDGTLGNYYSTDIRWSPDSRKVAACKIRPAEKRYVYYVESSPADQLQPRLHKQEYAKPGDELMFKVPCIFNIETGNAVIPDTKLFDRQYEILGPDWNSDSEAVTFEYNQRGHKVYRVLELSARTGQLRTLVEETADTYVNYPRRFRHDLADGRRMIWASERDNWNHLYMYDRSTGTPSCQITKGKWYVREVLRVDESEGKIYFSANGVDPTTDPYLIRYYSVRFDGSDLTCLTPDEGMHKASFSSDMKYLVDTYSMVDKAPVASLRDATDGREIMALETADISRLEAEGWKAPEVFVAKGRDGLTDMWGLIVRPTNFDPNKRYPIIEYIYQGPGDQYVPKTFMPYNWWMTSIAELGFVVVMVDGMGTSFRSREFENVCYRNLKDAALPDHMAWVRAAAAKYPYMDIDRVGIYGCSAGGQESTNAVLLYPEFYKAAYSACGCHDNRMDKIWWNELWMGYPVDEHYAQCSNVENAHMLQRPLMLVVGELDDNVDPASTMQLVNALIKANKDFELVVIPGAHHTMGDDFGEHKRYDFFVRHLLGVTPPKWSDLQ